MDTKISHLNLFIFLCPTQIVCLLIYLNKPFENNNKIYYEQ